MALTPSNMLPLGTEAPRFELWDSVSNTMKTLNNLQGSKGTLVLFICNHCPFVIHINKALVALANEVQTKGISMVAISSNDAKAYPQDGPDAMKSHAKKLNYPFPYLYDETQLVAKAYDAACTPTTIGSISSFSLASSVILALNSVCSIYVTKIQKLW